MSIRCHSKFVFTYVGSLVVATLMAGVSTPTYGQYYYVPSRDYYRNDTLEGTVVGGALGAVTGAIIGGKGDRGEGALIGAGVGALTGNLVGQSRDKADAYRAARESAAVSNANRQAASRAITNFDLIRLTQAGLDENVIINTMRTRGIRLDLSPDGLIALKENGVSDRVLVAAQEVQRAARAIPVVTEPAEVIVRPAPRYYYHPRPYPRHTRHYYHFHWGF